MRFVTIGDPHIGKLATIMGEEDALRRQSRLLRRQLDYAREVKADVAVIVGDLTDGPYPSQAHLVEICKALGNAKTDVILYLGNHDVDDSENTSFKLIRTLPQIGALRHVRFVTEPETIRDSGSRVRIIPWKDRYGKIHLDHADLVFFHDNVVGAARDNGMPIPEGKGLPKSVFRNATAIGGHLHTPQRTGDIWFCGTPAQLSFGERLPKRMLTGELSRGNVRLTSRPYEPPWILKTEVYDPHDPPDCNDAGTFYSLDVSKGRPGPRWLLDHPNVVKIEGGSSKKRKKAIEDVVDAATAGAVSESDHKLLNRWLRQYSSLTKIQRTQALRLNDKLEGGSNVD